MRVRLAQCGHEVPSHPGRQRIGCDVCDPGFRSRGKGGPPAAGPVVYTKCKVDGCEATLRRGSSRGMCEKHYQRLFRHGEAAVNPVRICKRDGCGVDISHRTAWAVWCSRRCYHIVNGDIRAEPFPEQVCALEGCDKVFTPLSPRQKCCSENHGQIHWNRVSRAKGEQKNTWDARRQANWAKREAVRKGATAAEAETILREEIGDRDGWRCGICRERIDRALNWPDPKSQSLDHIVPLSKGGDHTKANVRIAHLGCNVARGNRGSNEQLALIG